MLHRTQVALGVAVVLIVAFFFLATTLRSERTLEREEDEHAALSECLRTAAEDAQQCWTEHKRRAMLLAMQDAGGSAQDGLRYLTPSAYCEPLHLRRLGKDGDGGKWICGPLRVPDTPCTVLSFGSQGDFSFETALLENSELAQCNVHVFDCFWSGVAPQDIAFHPICAGSQNTVVDGRQYMTVPAIADMLDITQVAYMKFDIEGAEYALVDSLSTMPTSFLPPQISFELHSDWDGRTAARHTLRIVEQLDRLGYRIALIESNPGNDCCKELVMVRAP